MKFISIGPTCGTVTDFIQHNLRHESYPFDYLFSSLKMVEHCMEDGFETLLNKKYLIPNDKFPQSIQHTFYSTYIDTPTLRQHHLLEYKNILPSYIDYNRLNNSDIVITHNSSSAIIAKFPRDIFIHHNLFDNNIYDSFLRKCNRFNDVIKNEKVSLVYTNAYNKNIDDIIHFSEYLKKYENIFLIGILKNDDEQKVVFDNFIQSSISNNQSGNCKIYQNYDYDYIISDIHSLFLM